MYLKQLFFVVVLIFSQSLVLAADVDTGLAAFNAGDFHRAFQEWEPLALNCDAAAQHNLATLYDEGHGVTQDYAKAVTLYRKAAEQGYVHAQVNVGNSYAQGKGVSQNIREAVIWWRKAAEREDKMAQ